MAGEEKKKFESFRRVALEAPITGSKMGEGRRREDKRGRRYRACHIKKGTRMVRNVGGPSGYVRAVLVIIAWPEWSDAGYSVRDS